MVFRVARAWGLENEKNFFSVGYPASLSWFNAEVADFFPWDDWGSMSMRTFGLALLAAFLLPGASSAKDYYLTIGGGYAPSGNQASLERNVMFFQRILGEPQADEFRHDIFFSDGQAREADLQVLDRESVPKVNRLMAEFLGSRRNLGLQYRNHEIAEAKYGTAPANIERWFKEVGSEMREGDRLYLYVTAHGNRSSDRKDPYNTTIATWDRTSIKMKDLVKMLDRLESGVTVVTVMVQCHSGGFARFIFDQGDPENGLSSQCRVGFFATVHDRPAAGCTAEINEADYVEYSSFFWAALAGVNRLGEPIESPDYNEDGVVSFDEAHAYTLLTANTIDLPIKTSGEFLKVSSRFAGKDDDAEMELLGKEEPYETVLELASPADRAVLEGMSKQLELTGSDRLLKARKSVEASRKSSQGRRGRPPETERTRLQREIRNDLLKRWPALANTLNPIAIELLTQRAEEFVELIEGHPKFARYRELTEKDELNPIEKRVKYERFLRTADNVILAENLRRMNAPEKLAQYETLTEAESQSLGL